MHRKISKGTEKIIIFAKWIAGWLGVGAGGKPTLHLLPLYFWIWSTCTFYYIRKSNYFLNDEQKFTNHSMCKHFSTHIIISLWYLGKVRKTDMSTLGEIRCYNLDFFQLTGYIGSRWPLHDCSLCESIMSSTFHYRI